MNRLTCVLVCVVLLVASCGGTKKAEEERADDFPRLFVVFQNDKYGYIDKTGNVVITPCFDEASGFSEGLALVAIGDKWGYINQNGTYAINLQFSGGGDFSEGLARAKVGGKWGYVDRAGKYVVNPQFSRAGDFSDGLARAEVGGRWGYVDKTGKYVINPQFDEAGDFSEGLARVRAEQVWGYIDSAGKYVIVPQFVHAGEFREGLARVEIYGRCGYVDKTGRLAINPQFDAAGDFSEGLARVQVGREGCAPGRWGYINTEGNFVIDPQFECVRDFAQRLAAVRVTDKWGYIDKRGKYVIKPQFDLATGFSGELAKVEGGCGYVDRTGKLIWLQRDDLSGYAGTYSMLSETCDSCSELIINVENGALTAKYRSWYCFGGEYAPPEFVPLRDVAIRRGTLTGTEENGFEVVWDLSKGKQAPSPSRVVREATPVAPQKSQQPVQTSAAGSNTFTVSTAHELITAIGSDRVVRLKPGDYVLTHLSERSLGHVTWHGGEVHIENVTNLRLIGIGSGPVRLLVHPTDVYVLTFVKSQGVTLENMEFGHTEPGGFCIGGVLRFDGCSDVSIVGCTLFGSGYQGLNMSDVKGFSFTNSTIRDCSAAIMWLRNSSNIAFVNSDFFNNREYDLIAIRSCEGVRFINCDIHDNLAKSDDIAHEIFSVYSSSGIVLERSKIRNNVGRGLVGTKDAMMLNECQFEGNQFGEGIYSFESD